MLTHLDVEKQPKIFKAWLCEKFHQLLKAGDGYMRLSRRSKFLQVFPLAIDDFPIDAKTSFQRMILLGR